MVTSIPTPRPLPEALPPIPADLDPLWSQLVERERRLRELLFDARDALLRSQVEAEAPPPSGRGRSPAGSDPPGYLELRERLRELLTSTLPPGARVAVVSRGDDRLLQLGSATGAHFPDDGRGGYAGHHPGSSEEAIRALEDQRRRGAELLVFPETARWWLEHYRGFRRHLEERFRKRLDVAGTGVVFDLRAPDRAKEPSAEEHAAPRVGTSSRRPLAAATIISRNYLAQARVLARSFLEHEPGSRFYLLVIDHLPEGVEVGLEVVSIEPQELEVPSFWEMCFKYGVVELATAVKPFLLSLLFEKHGEEEVVYFDPDILVMRPLDELRSALSEGDIVLTPHITRPLPLDGKRPSEQDIMISGAFNLGFIALRRSPETRRFLEWWQERLEDGCRIDVGRGLFTDQKWIDLVPGLFPTTVILRDPTYNVAFWNLHEREISLEDGWFRVNGRPAAFFHISGFDPERPDRLSKHQDRIEVEAGSPLAALLERYGALLLANGHGEARDWGYGYDHFADGTRVHPLLRQLYLHLGPEERSRFGDPFAIEGDETFLAWATQPGDNGSLSRFLEAVHRARYDLPLSFPDVRGRDRAAFLRWARRWGAAEMGFDPGWVKDLSRKAQTDTPVAKDGETPRAASRAKAPARPADTAARAGYPALIERIRDVARGALPAGSRVLVISKGDYRLLDLGGCEGWHFPQSDDGVYGGFYPSSSEMAIAHLEALRERGADYLLIPQTAMWWLEFYQDLRRHLEERYRLVVMSHDSCRIYSLREPPRTRGPRSGRARWRRWLRGGAVAPAPVNGAGALR